MTTEREEVIAHLLSRPRDPKNAMYYMGVLVDVTWPAAALLAIAEQSAKSAQQQMESHLQSLSFLSAATNYR